MESGFLLSYGAFVAEVIAFAIGVVQATSNHDVDRARRVPSALVPVLAVLGVVALIFPASFIMSHPGSLAVAHPFSIALLVGAPAMPIAMLLLARRR